MLLLYVFPCTRSSVSMQNPFAHMNEQNAQHSTPDISQHIYSLKDTEILLLSEGEKGIKPEYTDKLIKPPVLRDQSTLIAHVPSMQAGVESPLPWPAHPGISEREYRHPAGSKRSSALALQLPQCRDTGRSSSVRSVPAPTPQLHQLLCNSSTSSPLPHPSMALETPTEVLSNCYLAHNADKVEQQPRIHTLNPHASSHSDPIIPSIFKQHQFRQLLEEHASHGAVHCLFWSQI